jgi:hypothetical protein
MSKYDDFDNRMYANWKDVVVPVRATINEVSYEEMPRTKKTVPVFRFPKEQFRFAVALTARVNRRAMAEITGREDPEDAVGHTIELYNDPTQRNPQTGEYGALRIRKPGPNGSNSGEKSATTSPHPPVPLSQPHADRPAKSPEEANDDLVAATDDEMPY